MNDLTKNVLVFIVIIVVLLSVVQGLSGVSGSQPTSKDYSEFQTQVRSGQVSVVVFDGQQIRFGKTEPLPFYTINPETDNTVLIGELMILTNAIAAKLAIDEKLPIIFRTQPQPT